MLIRCKSKPTFRLMNSVIGAGLKGVLAGMESAARHAEQVTQSFKPDSDFSPLEGLLGLSADKRQVDASIKIIKVGEDLDKAVLDILA